jgi:hypothetical protein
MVAAPVSATSYYVDAAGGNDSNSGTSRNDAFRTIQKAADTVSPGDTCLVLAGSYDERVQIVNSGESNLAIQYIAEGRVISQGFTIKADYIHVVGFEVTDNVDGPEDGNGIYVVGSYCEIKENYIYDVARQGIRLDADDPDSPSTRNCLVKDNIIVRAGQAGIDIYGRNHIIENNDISHTLQYTPQRPNPPFPDADGLRFFGSGHIIRKNYVHDILLSDNGNVDPHIDGAQTWGPAYDIIFEQNFFDIPDDEVQGFMIEETNAPVRDIIVRNNILQVFRGLNVFDCENITIANNTFKSKLSFTGESGYGIELHDSPNSSVVNNLFYDTGRNIYPYLYTDSLSESGLEVDYNCHFMSNGIAPAGNPYPNDLWQVNPQLVNVSDNDFRLKSNSPLIDAGKEVADVPNDYESLPRPQQTGYDISAYEYGSESGSGADGDSGGGGGGG